jgi:ferredoxin
MRTVFINPEQCIGCLQCEIACAIEHSVSKDGSVAFMETPVPRKRIHVEAGPVATTAFPNRCRHCNPAPCLQVVGAENLVHGHAASVYSWMTPAVRSCRRTRKVSRSVTGAGVALRGAAWLRARCGRCSL